MTFRQLMGPLREICDAAFADAEDAMEDFHPLTSSREQIRHFHRNCHAGLKLAQDRLIGQLLGIEEIRKQVKKMRVSASKQHDDVRRRAASETVHALKYSEMVYRHKKSSFQVKIDSSRSMSKGLRETYSPIYRDRFVHARERVSRNRFLGISPTTSLCCDQ
jgi:predicted site-specific integrase-resolvase